MTTACAYKTAFVFLLPALISKAVSHLSFSAISWRYTSSSKSIPSSRHFFLALETYNTPQRQQHNQPSNTVGYLRHCCYQGCIAPHSETLSTRAEQHATCKSLVRAQPFQSPKGSTPHPLGAYPQPPTAHGQSPTPSNSPPIHQPVHQPVYPPPPPPELTAQQPTHQFTHQPTNPN